MTFQSYALDAPDCYQKVNYMSVITEVITSPVFVVSVLFKENGCQTRTTRFYILNVLCRVCIPTDRTDYSGMLNNDLVRTNA